MIAVRAFHTDTFRITLEFHDALTNGLILDYGRNWEWHGEIYMLIGGQPLDVLRLSEVGNPLQFNVFTTADPEEDTLVISAWPAGWRGQNGEWIAPSQTFIGPVV